MIYLDNAATSSKKPPNVISAVLAGLNKYSANPGRSGHKASMEAAEAVFRVRQKVMKFFNADSEENVVFTSSCTFALNCVIKGVLKQGDHVLVSEFEHNAVMRPLEKLRREGKITYTVVPYDKENQIASFKNAIKENTKLIVCTHASNVLGVVFPIKEIGELARERNILFCVDAAQTAGTLPIDMKNMNVDFLCVAAHKGLLAPMGTGILIARRPIENTIIEGGTGTASLELNQPSDMPERFESGTVNVPGILGIGAGIDYIAKKGVMNIYRYEFNLLKHLYFQLSKNKNIQIYSPPPVFLESVAVLSFNVNGCQSAQVSEYLNKNGVAVRSGLHCAVGPHKKHKTEEQGMVRISIGEANTFYEINFLIKLLKNITI